MTQEWISVKERLPEHENIVIIYDGVLEDLGFWDRKYWHMMHGELRKGVTHWMPLPPPPEDAVRTALHMAKLAFHDYAMGYDHKYGNANEHYEDAIAAIALAEKELDK